MKANFDENDVSHLFDFSLAIDESKRILRFLFTQIEQFANFVLKGN